MEVNFENKIIEVYKELPSQTKNIQLSAESVVPDTDDDIGKAVCVQTMVLLKSKDITARGVLVSGEAIASFLYITENKEKVSCVKLSKSFSIEYDMPDIAEDAAAQIKLSVLYAEAKVINPRKLCVNFEISGELSCYVPEKINVESGIDPSACPGLHAKYESANLKTINAVCEKTLSLSEQFNFPSGKPKPEKIISNSVEFIVNEYQLVGTKVIVKGNASINVYYLSNEVNYPVKAEFSTSFSQIIDIEKEELDNCFIIPSLTGTYFDLADSINGEKMMDVELYAVLQLVCRSSREVVYIADAYSNLMPANCAREKTGTRVISDSRKIKLSSDERLSIMDDCADVLSLFVSVNRVEQEQNKLKCSLNIDVVYRSSSGQLSSARRSVELQTECSMDDYRISGVRLTEQYLRPDGQYLDAHFSLEISCVIYETVEIDKIISIELDENEPLDYEKFPTLNLVRCDGESLWELAKQYHSSVEKISASNSLEAELSGRMILIPKSI